MVVHRDRIIEILHSRDNQGHRQEHVHPLAHFDNRALLMMDLVKAWSAMAIASDSKTAPTPTFTLVTRAAELVDAVWQEAENRGWMVRVPSWNGEEDDA